MPKRYHPVLVTLHWLVALLVASNLYLGLFAFVQPGFEQQDPPYALAIHMAFGITVLLLVIVRFIVRLRFKRPADATTGNKLLDLAARLVHYGLYLTLVALTLFGLTFAIQTNRLQETFFGAGSSLSAQAHVHDPAHTHDHQHGEETLVDFVGVATQGSPFASDTLRALHALTARLLIGLVTLHVGAAFYHQFIRRDNLIARMWYGP